MELAPIEDLVAQATKLNPTFKHDVARVMTDDGEVIRVTDTATIKGEVHELSIDLPIEKAHRQEHLERQNLLVAIHQLGRS